jgi:transcription elongation factor GreA
MEKTPMTREGFTKMSEDLQKMRQIDLKECLENLADAREKGDLSENVEYEVAKQALEDLNNKMGKVSKILNNVQIIDGIIDDGTVQMLTWVKFKNLKNKIDTEYRIVPEHEISLKEGKISPLSPFGKALMGKKIGEKVTFEVPAGKMELEILNIRVR